MLLEEIILKFLHVNGYSPIDTALGDSTLVEGPAGIRVLGRGSSHQIDAIADYRLKPPFSHPYRLLVEAKSLGKPVGLGVIRNALGVLRDVSEYWKDREQPRFHYQYAVFTDTRFTTSAQNFGYVQDIFLLPLAKGGSMALVLEALHAIRKQDVPSRGANRRLGNLRRAFRTALRTGQVGQDLAFTGPLVATARAVQQAVIGVTPNGFPIFLVPTAGIEVAALVDQYVTITWDELSWYLNDADGRTLFTFDLPEQLFKLYADQGRLTPAGALDIKESALSEIQATVFAFGGARVVRFLLDKAWTERVRGQIIENPQRSRREKPGGAE